MSPEDAIDFLIARNEQRQAQLRTCCESLRANLRRSARARQRLTNRLTATEEPTR